MADMLVNRRLNVMSITLIVNIDAEGKSTHQAYVVGHENDDSLSPIGIFEIACAAARAAEAVWTKE